MYRVNKRPDSEDDVEYCECRSKIEARNNTDGQQIEVKIQVKDQVVTPLPNLCEAFERELKLVMAHQYRIIHQYDAIRTLKRIAGPGEYV